MVLPLNWQNDCLLIDPEPVPKTHWLTANDLIEQESEESILQKDNTFTNLYGILVRKSDFLRTNTLDRILARFPFLVLTENQKKWVKENDLLLSEAARDYFYKSDNRSILSWRKIIRKYLKRGIIPYPLYRLGDILETKKQPPDITREKYVYFSSARGELFKIPNQLTKEIAYLAGVINGDGNLRRYILSIVDFSHKNIKWLKQQFELQFDQEGRIQWQTENSPEIIITNKWIVRFFSYLTDQPIDDKKYDDLREPLIFQKEPFRTHYWSGVLDADGSYANNNITFTSASAIFVKDFQKFITTKNIESKIQTQKNGGYQVYISRGFHEKFKKYLKSFHPEKKIEFQNLQGKRSIWVKHFTGFNNESLVNGYFNFRLLSGLRVYGLDNFLKRIRKGRLKKDFARLLEISPSSLREMEAGLYGINLPLLEKILELEGQELMPFLANYEELKYRMRSSKLVKLSYKPNEKFAEIASQLIFFKNLIRFPADSNLKNDIQKLFSITLKKDTITTKIILDFFKAFCHFSRK